MFKLLLLVLLVSCGLDSSHYTYQRRLEEETAPAIEVVKFCEELEDIYPTQFPEYGLCINNQLYGVYSHPKGSFLALLMPGAYQTTTNGINCRFEVIEDSCEIIRL